MNIHLITYLTSKLFWIYTVFRYNTILYPKNEDTQKLFAYFCAYLLSCWGSMQWGTMYGDLIFELIALLIITVAYQADWQHHVWNILMVYIMGILCDGIPIVFFQRYAVARNPVKVSYARQNCAIGGVSFAIETGKAFLKGLETSVEEGVNSLCTFLNGRILARGPVQNFSIETTGGFDVGYATVDGCDMTFWNEYATVEKMVNDLLLSLTLS